MQVSGSTIYVAPLAALPLRNVPVIAPAFALDADDIDSAAVAAAIKAVLKRLDLDAAETPVAVFVPWRGSATFQRLDGFCRGVVDGLAAILADGHPLVLAGDGDIGGLIGIHLREEMQLDNAIVSVDGLELKEFDYIDIGTMLPNSGAVPVVIKSLIFPAESKPVHPLGGAAHHRMALGGAEARDQLGDAVPGLLVAGAEQDHRPVARRHDAVGAEQVEHVIGIAPDGVGRPAPAHDDVEPDRELDRHVAVLGGAGNLRRPRLPALLRDRRPAEMVHDDLELGQSLSPPRARIRTARR